MTTVDQIEAYLSSRPEPQQSEMRHLHMLISFTRPGCRLWFDDGLDTEGNVVADPVIGYGSYIVRYVNGTDEERFQIGLSASEAAISVFVMGLDDTLYLRHFFGDAIGDAYVTGHCIRFNSIREIDLGVLQAAVLAGFEAQTPGL